MRGRSNRKPIGIDYHPPAPIPECGPSIRLAKNILPGQLARAHFFIAPKHIALRMAALGEKAIGQPYCLYRFAVIDGANFDSGGFFKIAENRFCIDPILGAIDNHLILLPVQGTVSNWTEDYRQSDANNRNKPKLT